MGTGLDDLKWLGPFAAPIAITLSLLGLIGGFLAYGPTLGWKIISAVFLLVTIGWSLWYLLATDTEPSLIADGEPRKARRHRNKWWRRSVVLFPVLAAGLFAASFLLQPKEFDYSKFLEGGGPTSPIVVFDSNPRGAEVRVAKFYYADDDPHLEDKTPDRVLVLPEKTLTRTRLWQGNYWVVFKLNGNYKTRYISVTGPQVVKVEF